MYKIINPKGINLYFEGNGASIIFSGKKSLAVKIRVISDKKKYSQQDIEAIDGFNILDIQIVSEEVKQLIHSWENKGEIEFIKVKLIFEGYVLKRNYYALEIKNLFKVSILSATETDWAPDARYPVKNIKTLNDIFMDKELKFPVFTKKIIKYFYDKHLNITFYKYDEVNRTQN